MNNNLPTEAGLYWGRTTNTMQWYDLIICVCGEAPFLYVEHVYNRGRLDGPKVQTANYSDILIGPKLEVPDVSPLEMKRHS